MDSPQRKHPRLKNFDYSSGGVYYVTIHTAKDASNLSEVIGSVASTSASVGRGLAPAVNPDFAMHNAAPGEANVCLTEIGQEAVRQLFALEERFPFVRVANYVVMPTHIHLLLYFDEKTAGPSPRPALPDVICAYKSLTTRRCNLLRQTPGKTLFQASLYEHVVRNEADFRQIWEYIDGNPSRWLEKCRQNESP